MKQNILIKRLTVSCFLEYGLVTNEQTSPTTVTILLRIHREHRQNATFDLQDSSDPLEGPATPPVSETILQKTGYSAELRGDLSHHSLTMVSWGVVGSDAGCSVLNHISPNSYGEAVTLSTSGWECIWK